MKNKNLSISTTATRITNTLIATHGLANAYEVAKRIHEQAIAQVKSQVTRHPDEWPDKIKAEVGLQTEQPAQTNKKIPPVPSIG